MNKPELQTVRNIALLAKPGRADLAEYGRSLLHWLEERSREASFSLFEPQNQEFIRNTRDADLLVVIGGDGSLISVARHFAASPKPMLGFNCGRVGFLCEIGPRGWEKEFARILDQGIRIKKSLGLSFSLHAGADEICSGLAVNDLLISRGLTRLPTLELALDGTYLTSLRADGIILSTPMGSTGYAASAGGPLLRPELNAYSVTAVCPFMSRFLPLVLAGESSFRITIKEADADLALIVDGQENFPLREGLSIRVQGRPNCIALAAVRDEAAVLAKFRTANYL